LLSGDAALPQYAMSKQKGVEVFIWKVPGTTPTVEAGGTVFWFNANGSVDLAEAAEVAAIAIEVACPDRMVRLAC
jgi:hypothetical protein